MSFSGARMLFTDSSVIMRNTSTQSSGISSPIQSNTKHRPSEQCTAHVSVLSPEGPVAGAGQWHASPNNSAYSPGVLSKADAQITAPLTLIAVISPPPASGNSSFEDSWEASPPLAAAHGRRAQKWGAQVIFELHGDDGVLAP
jgi:hypothetical protein